jgi:DNA polymerase III epsilon subunit-like protein
MTCPHEIPLNEHCEDCLTEERDGWKHKPWFIFDLETTGVDPATDRICQLGGVWMHNGEMTDRRLVTINPGVPIPEGASRVHGITDERVAQAPTFAEVFPKVLEHFRRAEVVLTYNGSRFDWPLLVHESGRLDPDHGDLIDAVAETLFVDVLVQVRRKSVGRFWKSGPGGGRHRLQNVAARMDIRLPPGMRPHRADADCYIAGRILWETRGKLPHTAADVRELLDDRQREQEEDYQRWRALQDRAEGRTT